MPTENLNKLGQLGRRGDIWGTFGDVSGGAKHTPHSLYFESPHISQPLERPPTSPTSPRWYK